MCGMVHHANSLASFLHTRLGDDLRAVGRYWGDDDEWIYLREDLRQRYARKGRGFEDFSEEARTVHDCLDAVSGPETPVGSSQASLHAFDRALVAHFFLGEGRGVVVSFEPEVGGRLQAFVDRCRGILEDGTTPESTSVTPSAGTDCDPQAAE